MPDLRSIPDDTKWQLATRLSATLPVLYEMVFRPAAGDKFDELEQEVWARLSDLSLDIARSLQLPLKNAQEIAKAMLIVSSILFGPDFKGEVIEVGDDGAVIIVKRCPLAGACSGCAEPGGGIFHRCMAFMLMTQNAFNPKYSSRFVRAACMGDRQCEIKVEPQVLKGEKREEAAST